MGSRSVTRGKHYERWIAARWRKLWPDAIVRRSSQAERADNADLIVEGGPPALSSLWLELNDASQPAPLTKLAQAERDVVAWWAPRRTEQRLPIVIWHRIGGRRHQATMRLHVLDVLRGLPPRAPDDAVVTLDLEDLERLLGGAP